MMGALTLETWLVCLLLLMGPSLLKGQSITNSPGVLRTYLFSQAKFRWSMDVNIDGGELRKGPDPLTGIRLAACSSGSQTPVYVDPSYNGRISCGSEATAQEFIITDIPYEESGQYSCSLNPAGAPSVTDNNAVIYIYKKPTSPVLGADSIGVDEGHKVTLQCTVEANSVPAEYRLAMQFIWMRNGMQFTDLEKHVIDNGTVWITTARDDRWNIYSCQALETGSVLMSETSNAKTFDVYYAPSGASVSQQPAGPVKQSDYITLTCAAQEAGNPPTPQFHWYKGNSSRGSQNPFTTTVTVDNDDGSWRCTVDNEHGTAAEASFNIVVYARPVIKTDLRNNDTTSINMPVGMKCGFDCRPGSIIQWHYNGKAELPFSITATTVNTTSDLPGGKYIYTESTLDWTPGSTPEDRRGSSGLYKCVATNAAGNIESNQMYLGVQYNDSVTDETTTNASPPVEGAQIVLATMGILLFNGWHSHTSGHYIQETKGCNHRVAHP